MRKGGASARRARSAALIDYIQRPVTRCYNGSEFPSVEKLDDANFEAEEMSFAQELQTMPAFSAEKDDETRLKTYILQNVPPMLKKELDTYH